MCIESAAQAAQVKKAWKKPLQFAARRSSRGSVVAGDAYTCLYDSENGSLGETAKKRGKTQWFFDVFRSMRETLYGRDVSWKRKSLDVDVWWCFPWFCFELQGSLRSMFLSGLPRASQRCLSNLVRTSGWAMPWPLRSSEEMCPQNWTESSKWHSEPIINESTRSEIMGIFSYRFFKTQHVAMSSRKSPPTSRTLPEAVWGLNGDAWTKLKASMESDEDEPSDPGPGMFLLFVKWKMRKWIEQAYQGWKRRHVWSGQNHHEFSSRSTAMKLWQSPTSKEVAEATSTDNGVESMPKAARTSWENAVSKMENLHK